MNAPTTRFYPMFEDAVCVACPSCGGRATHTAAKLHTFRKLEERFAEVS